MATLQYSSLDPSRREIRLIVLHPAPTTGCPGDMLEMSLIKTTLFAPEPYTALSYTWGDQRSRYPVRINGANLTIGHNLHQALTQFRSERSNDLTLWVDAVCINQADVRERELQVCLMRNIYKGAGEVLVWLGPAAVVAGETVIFSFLHDLAAIERGDIQDDLRHAMVPRPETVQWLEQQARESYGAYLKLWVGVADLLDSPWFSRMWIIQEAVMGKAVTVVRGSTATSWDDVFFFAGKFIHKYMATIATTLRSPTLDGGLAEEVRKKMVTIARSVDLIDEIGRSRLVAKNFHQGQDDKDRPVGGFSSPSEEWLPARLTKSSKFDVASFHPKSVYHMVRHFARFNVTEPRDKIYALLGILEDFGRPMVFPTISYSTPIPDLYWDIIRAHIERTGTLDFLEDASGIQRPFGLPSWIPHWYHNGGTEEGRPKPLSALELPPEISHSAMAGTLPFCYFNPRLKALRIAGTVGAVVQQLGDAMDPPEPDDLTDENEKVARIMQAFNRTMVQWVSLLGLTNVFPGEPPYQLDLDKPNLTKTEVKAYTLLATINMIDDPHNWPEDKLFDLYEARVRKHRTPRLHGALSARAYISARQLYATNHRRLYITRSGNFGLCPKDTKVGDVVVYLFGCKVPMVLRPVDKPRGVLWRVVGEAYSQYDMNGRFMDVVKKSGQAFFFWVV